MQHEAHKLLYEMPARGLETSRRVEEFERCCFASVLREKNHTKHLIAAPKGREDGSSHGGRNWVESSCAIFGIV